MRERLRPADEATEVPLLLPGLLVRLPHGEGPVSAAKVRRLRLVTRKGRTVVLRVKFNPELVRHYRAISERTPLAEK